MRVEDGSWPFHDIRSGTLNGSIDCLSFFPVAESYIGRVGQVREITAPSQHGFDVTLAGSHTPNIIKIALPREILEVILDEIFGFTQS